MFVNLCCTVKWISYMYTYIPSLLSFPPTAAPDPTSLAHRRAPSWALYAIQKLPTSYLFYTCSVWMSILLSQSAPPSLSPSVSTSLFCTSAFLFLPCKYVHKYHFSRFPIYALVVLFNCPVVSGSLQLHGLQHARPPCPSPSPEVCPSSCPLHRWCHPAILSSDCLFFCPQSFPASGSFPVSQLFMSGDQNIGASAKVLSMSIQGWFPLRLTGLIPLLSKGQLRVFSTTVRRQ